jgi:hypothetical protein
VTLVDPRADEAVNPVEDNDTLVSQATADAVELACECGDARGKLTRLRHARIGNDGLPYAEFERFALVFDE